MPDEKSESRRFDRIRRVRDDISDAALTLTGHTVAQRIDEFIDTYSTVLTGLAGDAEENKRAVKSMRADWAVVSEEVNQRLARVEKAYSLLRVAVFASLALGLLAILIAVFA